MVTVRSDDAGLRELAQHLKHDLAYRLLQLVDADGRAQHNAQLTHDLQRAEDLVAELRRQYAARDRQVNQARARIVELETRNRVLETRAADPGVPMSLRERLDRAGGIS